MPCYEVRTVTVEFKVANIDLLKRAVVAMGLTVQGNSKTTVSFYRNGNAVLIDCEKQTITASNLDTKQLSGFSNSLKRSYSSIVIDEVARKQKWIKKNLGNNRYQLQRF
jgi:hypothetical protein